MMQTINSSVVSWRIKLTYCSPVYRTNPAISRWRQCVYQTVTVNDFRDISISPLISKVFGHCILERYAKFFVTSNSKFGFKKKSGCAHAVSSLRCVVDYGSTVNICALDLSKAFDKMNHHGLFVKLMQRRVPVKLLCVLEYWFAIGSTCVKWYSCFHVPSVFPAGLGRAEYYRHIYSRYTLIVCLQEQKVVRLDTRLNGIVWVYLCTQTILCC